jgi:hypothetical protein
VTLVRLVSSGGLSVRVTSGCTVSIVQPYVAAALWLPSASTDATRKVWGPSARPEYVAEPDEQSLAAPPSTRQAIAALGSASVKVNVALLVPLGVDGAAVMTGDGGGVASIAHVYELGAGSTFPTPSTDRTRKVCRPSDRPLYDAGFAQVAKPAPSSSH